MSGGGSSAGKMTAQSREGVFYESRDCAGIVRRLFILAVDFTVVVALVWLLFVAAVFSETLARFFVPVCGGVCYGYLAGLKATRLGTLGYRLAGVRLVDLQGRQAALWRSTFRLGFLVFGPLNLLFDILWLGGDPNRQSVRDKFAGTYVVRRRATPAGRGRIDYKTYYMMSYNLVFPEVVRECDGLLSFHL